MLLPATYLKEIQNLLSIIFHSACEKRRPQLMLDNHLTIKHSEIKFLSGKTDILQLYICMFHVH